MKSPLRFALNRMVAPNLSLPDFIQLAAALNCEAIEIRNDLKNREIEYGTPASRVRELCAAPAAITGANLVLTTGEQLYALRFAPGQRATRPLYLSWRRTCLVVASEPLTRDPARWQPLDHGTLLIADTRLNVHTLQLTAEG